MDSVTTGASVHSSAPQGTRRLFVVTLLQALSNGAEGLQSECAQNSLLGGFVAVAFDAGITESRQTTFQLRQCLQEEECINLKGTPPSVAGFFLCLHRPSPS
jgi:hypothetical protein